MNHLSRIMAVLFFCSSAGAMLNAEDDFDNSPLDPTIPIHPVGFYNGSPGAWFMYGELLCISVNNGIEFWEKVDETHSRVVSRIENTGPICAFTRKEHVVYALDVDGRIHVINAGDPRSAKVTARVMGLSPENFGSWSDTEFFVVGHYLVNTDNPYYRQHASTCIKLYDVSNPEIPSLPPTLEWEDTIYLGGNQTEHFQVFTNEASVYCIYDEAETHGGKIKLIKADRNGESVVLLTNESEFFDLAIEDGVASILGESGERVVLYENGTTTGDFFAFAHYRRDGPDYPSVIFLDEQKQIQVVEPSEKQDASIWDDDLPMVPPSPIILPADQFAVWNNILFVADEDQAFVHQIDLSIPDQPRLATSIKVESELNDINVYGDHLLVVSGDYLEIYSMKDASPISQVRRLARPDGLIACSISRDGRRLASLTNRELLLFRIELDSELHRQYMMDCKWSDFIQVGELLFGQSDGEIELFDISDPLHPTRLSRLATAGSFMAVAPDGRGIISGRQNEFDRTFDYFDTRNPMAPVKYSRTPMQECGMGGWGSFCVSSQDVFAAYLCSNTQSRYFGIYRLPTRGLKEDTSAELIFRGESGPYGVAADYPPYEIAVVNNHLCIGAGESGLAIIPLKEPQ